jgi:23S rRNA pseudouridine955/2504/2580 synthase
MSGVETVAVQAEEADQRLDRWLRRRFPGLTQGRIEKLLRKGEIRLDGKRADGKTRIFAGQMVRLPPNIEKAVVVHKDGPAPVSEADARFVRSLVIHEDADVIAINKPAGLAVQGGTGQGRHLDGMLGAFLGKDGERPRLVHRLDLDTSGVLVLGRNVRATAFLAEAFRGRSVRKTYWALVAGVPRPAKGRIDMALAKSGGPGGERVARDDDEGKRAVTLYATVDSALERCAWLAMRPVTGRTHQLRVHAAEALGHADRRRHEVRRRARAARDRRGQAAASPARARARRAASRRRPSEAGGAAAAAHARELEVLRLRSRDRHRSAARRARRLMAASGRLRLAVFDCDGTLVDSQHAIVACMHAAFASESLGLPEAEAVRRLVGLPLSECVARLAVGADAARQARLVDAYKENFFVLRQRPDHHEPLFEGCLDALAAIEDAGWLLGIATGKARRGLDAVLARHGLGARFVTLQTGDLGPGKPHPAMLERALVETGVAAADCVMIGDTTYDMEMARSAGVAGIAVAWGYHPVPSCWRREPTRSSSVMSNCPIC